MCDLAGVRQGPKEGRLYVTSQGDLFLRHQGGLASWVEPGACANRSPSRSASRCHRSRLAIRQSIYAKRNFCIALIVPVRCGAVSSPSHNGYWIGRGRQLRCRSDARDGMNVGRGGLFRHEQIVTKHGLQTVNGVSKSTRGCTARASGGSAEQLMADYYPLIGGRHGLERTRTPHLIDAADHQRQPPSTGEIWQAACPSG